MARLSPKPHKVQTTPVSWLAIWRLESNLTQQEMANRIGISRTYFNAIENEHRRFHSLRGNLLASIAKVVGLSIEELVANMCGPNVSE